MSPEDFEKLAPGDKVVFRGFKSMPYIAGELVGEVFVLDRRDSTTGWISLLTDRHRFLVRSASVTTILLRSRDIEALDCAFQKRDSRFPHTCPKCRGPAYIGAVPAAFECRAACRL